MLIAVGMYLPFETTFAIFVGGVMRWWLDRALARRKASDEGALRAGNVGTLIASGLIAGEALMGVGLALLAIGGIPSITALLTGRESFAFVAPLGGWLSLAIFGAVAWGLIRIPLAAAERSN
jgi:uncharacterized oligopeptide transporter (OPT) family protein